MSNEPDTASISASTLRDEVEQAAGDLSTIGDILLSIGRSPDIDILHGWLGFFGRAVDAIADQLEETARRLA